MLRDVFSGAPVLRVERSLERDVAWDWRKPRQRRRVARELEAAGSWEMEERRPAFRESAVVRVWLSQKLTYLVEVGAFAPDIDL